MHDNKTIYKVTIKPLFGDDTHVCPINIKFDTPAEAPAYADKLIHNVRAFLCGEPTGDDLGNQTFTFTNGKGDQIIVSKRSLTGIEVKVREKQVKIVEGDDD